jgi:hypothetical protein
LFESLDSSALLLLVILTAAVECATPSVKNPEDPVFGIRRTHWSALVFWLALVMWRAAIKWLIILSVVFSKGSSNTQSAGRCLLSIFEGGILYLE